MTSDAERRPANRLIKIVASILLLVMMLFIAEAFFMTYYWLRDGRWESVAERLAPGQGNTFIRDLHTSEGMQLLRYSVSSSLSGARLFSQLALCLRHHELSGICRPPLSDREG